MRANAPQAVWSSGHSLVWMPPGAAERYSAGVSATVLIVEDHPGMRTALQMLLRACRDKLAFCAAARGGGEAVRLATEHRPDVVCLDLSLPGNIDGFQTCRMLRALPDPPAVVVYTASEQLGVADRALAAGAMSVVSKSDELDELRNALLFAVHGKSVISEAFRSLPAPELTVRQLEVLDGVVRGLSNPDIAAELGVGVESVKTHVSGVIQRLGARDRTHAAALGVREGLVSPPTR